EQHAIATGVHPRVNTEANVANMRRQLRRLGLGHDARRSVSTTDEDFYRWTQWIFLQVFNSWYDEIEQRARPIIELEQAYADGSIATPNGQPWNEHNKHERRQAIDARRLAYLSEAPVNWCPGLGTILANEEVTADGRSDIGNYPVFKKSMRQWTMRITTYADRLLQDLDRLDWPEPIKLMQRNWIGRSEGARVDFTTPAGILSVFTTRPDTLFGASFMVISPEHPLVDALTTSDNKAAVDAYRIVAASKNQIDRQDDTREKTGVFTGTFATNPVNGQEIPVWVADYVLMGYGTGAIMAVPCGDQRDFQFARRFHLAVPAIQQPPSQWFTAHDLEPQNGDGVDTSTWNEAFVGDGAYINSSSASLSLNGLVEVHEGIKVMNTWLEENGCGLATVNFKLRDWLFSRQRYWGEPFPIVYDEDDQPVSLPDSMLPVLLPQLEDFKPQALDPNDEVTDPIPPLARSAQWREVVLDLGDGPKKYRREINVMPQWAGSCWYELRYLDPTNTEFFVDPAVEKYWMGPADGGDGKTGHTGGVDLYVGGVEHAVLHLLYARFWHKVLFDLGHLSSSEPFHRLFNQGYIQAFAYRDPRGQPVTSTDVEERDGTYWYAGEEVQREYGKMGKSLKNIVTPDEMYDEYGADTFRLYEMSSGPLEASRPWNTRDVIGMQRFLQRVWRNMVDEDTGASRVVDTPATPELRKLLHRMIEGIRSDMDGLRFNTAIAKLIELNNALTQEAAATGSTPLEIASPMIHMLAPLCPHMAEELWGRLGHSQTLTFEPFPVFDPQLLIDDTFEYPVQINGKVRSRLVVPTGTDLATVQALVLSDPKVLATLGGQTPKKVVVVPGRMVNLVL
ncbi:MAG: leucine--tRNA ligase, partial [Actinobacteria bacterium]|nr:leucine--tRNA ligase [Actinomycetota bacterium]